VIVGGECDGEICARMSMYGGSSRNSRLGAALSGVFFSSVCFRITTNDERGSRMEDGGLKDELTGDDRERGNEEQKSE
jgi:hypothetical protein